MTPRAVLPTQHPAPLHPRHKPRRQASLHSARLDPDFLNPDRTLHFAHQGETAEEVDDDAYMLSTRRLEREIARVEAHAPSLDSVELDSVDKQAIMKQAPPPGKGRYDAKMLPDVDAPTPVKARKVKKQVSEKWKQAHEIAPSIALNPAVDHGRETRIFTTPHPSLFQWNPPPPTNDDFPPRYLKETVVYFR
ncbi:Aste57867_20560 [Aphanomyces stellatus]|uniref:Aste57867_20560 protein n=1 Tax=Aphanomyces stellatus TaxID=120398 RepID=A0A485LJZ5_9STRA|nr:hypothetical protein As57867_020493 [Aphanomyces stellatus]VFT97244.1 Aste57867_20560 [Aphanomyces stellatus]